ncbi:OsmC family protein [Flavimarina sp. Hel_I_48]|uniref:OsmC family protein n=1 Tax=Flavimarina sp. Hel_I_48 TaxID=1392488 RepID=UPI0004DEF681|nr:OsmC family protein [Flavimarina sp. Hel_I_48]
MTSKVVYQGNLRTQCTHEQSGNTFITDAPVDNNGKGEAFSPTDTVATALGSCMLTIMGIKAAQMDISLTGSYAEVLKTMSAEPRRIAGIGVTHHLPSEVGEKDRTILERVALACPVHASLHPDMNKDIKFLWDL